MRTVPYQSYFPAELRQRVSRRRMLAAVSTMVAVCGGLGAALGFGLRHELMPIYVMLLIAGLAPAPGAALSAMVAESGRVRLYGAGFLCPMAGLGVLAVLLVPVVAGQLRWHRVDTIFEAMFAILCCCICAAIAAGAGFPSVVVGSFIGRAAARRRADAEIFRKRSERWGEAWS